MLCAIRLWKIAFPEQRVRGRQLTTMLMLFLVYIWKSLPARFGVAKYFVHGWIYQKVDHRIVWLVSFAQDNPNWLGFFWAGFVAPHNNTYSMYIAWPDRGDHTCQKLISTVYLFTLAFSCLHSQFMPYALLDTNMACCMLTVLLIGHPPWRPFNTR